MPRYPEVMMQRSRRIAVIAALVMAPTIIIWLQAGKGSWMNWVALLCFITEFTVFTHVVEWDKNRLAKYVRAHNGQVCPQCGYLLIGLPEGGRCPECGVQYSPEMLAEAWHKAML